MACCSSVSATALSGLVPSYTPAPSEPHNSRAKTKLVRFISVIAPCKSAYLLPCGNDRGMIPVSSKREGMTMKPDEEFDALPDDDSDLLENSGLSKQYVSRLRGARFRRLSDFDDMSDIEILREPGASKRIIKAIREQRARVARK